MRVRKIKRITERRAWVAAVRQRSALSYEEKPAVGKALTVATPATLDHADMLSSCRVLVVTNMWPHAGDPSFGSFVQEQMESLLPLGVGYDVFFINGRASRWNYASGGRELRRRLRTGHYDLVHAHFGLSGWIARCQLDLPVVVTFHGDDLLGKFRFDGSITPLGRLFQVTSRMLAPFVRAVIVQSHEMRRMLHFARVYVIPCGIDLDLFRPMEQQAARQALGLDPETKYLLFAYDPAEQRKRYDLIERAMALARSRIPELEILHARGKAHAQMPLYMNAADVLVVASEAEGGPLVTKEAMAVNLPVISVRVGDVADLFRNSEGNHIVPRDAAAIAERLVEVCQRGARSRGRDCLANFSMPATARKVFEVYEWVLGCPGSHGQPFCG
jgi:glycosyltransferase involved in cell wall biosynthesis